MDRVICNIPHAGRAIPEWAIEDFLIDRHQMNTFAAFMADKDVDQLFHFVPEGNKVVASLSRVVLDIERYRNDADEPMAALGMGLFYTQDHLGEAIRRKGNTYSKCLKLYDEYHAELESKVKRCLDEHGSCCVLDCHSFHDEMLYTGYEAKDFPDICIGFNEEIPSAEVGWIRELFEMNSYQVKLNMPFSGSFVPLKYLNDASVKSIMLELNRRIYCRNRNDFEKCSMLCEKVYEYLNCKA